MTIDDLEAPAGAFSWAAGCGPKPSYVGVSGNPQTALERFYGVVEWVRVGSESELLALAESVGFSTCSISTTASNCPSGQSGR